MNNCWYYKGYINQLLPQHVHLQMSFIKFSSLTSYPMSGKLLENVAKYKRSNILFYSLGIMVLYVSIFKMTAAVNLGTLKYYKLG